MKKNDKKIAVFSGTFDPVTLGHIDIIERAASLFDEVHVLIAVNPEKSTMFTEDERLGMLVSSVSSLGCAERVKCVVWERPVFEYCKKAGSGVIVKGLRNSSDFDYERILAKQTDSLCDGIETVLLYSREKYDYISSTYVRGCIGYGYPIDSSVPAPATEIIERKFSEDR